MEWIEIIDALIVGLVGGLAVLWAGLRAIKRSEKRMGRIKRRLRPDE